MNAPANRTPSTGSGLMASAGRSMQRLAKPVATILRREPKNTTQDATNEAQSDVPSPATSTTVVFTPDRSDSNADTSQNNGVSNANASFLSEVSGRTPWFESRSQHGPTIAGPIPA